MGAWNTVRNYIDRTLEIIEFRNTKVKYVGRNASSTTATGNYNKHLAEQKPENARIFSLGRVFRNEKVSYKHLVEFNQIEMN